MTLEEFRRLADTWGGDIERWPARTQSVARQRAATKEGAEILAQARQLDPWLAAAPDVAPDRAARAAFAVVQRIAVGDAVPVRPASWWRRTWLMPVAGLAFSALIGRFAGNAGALWRLDSFNLGAERHPRHGIAAGPVGAPMMRKWIALGSPRTLALIASLCLNVLMGSYIAAQWVRASVPPLVAATTPPRLIRFVADRLPSADAGTLWRVYGAKEAELRATQADYEHALRQAAGLLAQTQVDAAALRAAVLEAREKRIKVGDIVMEMFLEAFPQLSPQGRRDLVGRLRDR